MAEECLVRLNILHFLHRGWFSSRRPRKRGSRCSGIEDRKAGRSGEDEACPGLARLLLGSADDRARPSTRVARTGFASNKSDRAPYETQAVVGGEENKARPARAEHAVAAPACAVSTAIGSRRTPNGSGTAGEHDARLQLTGTMNAVIAPATIADRDVRPRRRGHRQRSPRAPSANHHRLAIRIATLGTRYRRSLSARHRGTRCRTRSRRRDSRRPRANARPDVRCATSVSNSSTSKVV